MHLRSIFTTGVWLRLSITHYTDLIVLNVIFFSERMILSRQCCSYSDIYLTVPSTRCVTACKWHCSINAIYSVQLWLSGHDPDSSCCSTLDETILFSTIKTVIKWTCIMPTSFAPSPIASVIACTSLRTISTISAFCSGDTRQQMTDLHHTANLRKCRRQAAESANFNDCNTHITHRHT